MYFAFASCLNCTTSHTVTSAFVLQFGMSLSAHNAVALTSGSDLCGSSVAKLMSPHGTRATVVFEETFHSIVCTVCMCCRCCS